MRLLHCTNPPMHGQDVDDAQWLLEGHNRFKVNFHPGPVDGVYGERVRDATRHAKYALGYPQKAVDGFWGGVFGPRLYSYLLPKGHKGWKPLPLTYRVRRAQRLKAAQAENTVRARALKLALTQVGYHEAGYSNYTKYGAWYGLNGEPWCAIFVSYCLSHAGDKRGRKTAYAYQWEYWGRANENGLSITHDPQPGDIVVYHHHAGHTGFFYRWTDRARGEFQAVEGNTMIGGSQDNGGTVAIQNRHTGWVPTVFVSVRD